MSSFTAKVYIVQKFDRAGNPGEVIAVKLTLAAAHAIAKAQAPAKVIFGIADKTGEVNIPAPGLIQR